MLQTSPQFLLPQFITLSSLIPIFRHIHTVGKCSVCTLNGGMLWERLLDIGAYDSLLSTAVPMQVARHTHVTSIAPRHCVTAWAQPPQLSAPTSLRDQMVASAYHQVHVRCTCDITHQSKCHVYDSVHPKHTYTERDY